MIQKRMIKRFVAAALAAGLCLGVAACGSKAESSSVSGSGAAASSSVTEAAAPADGTGAAASSSASDAAELADGTYDADFTTDSKMFHVNEAMDGKGKLTVRDGVMTIHISLTSENIVNLFEGTAEDAQKEGAKLLEPTTDTVKYDDGTTEEVYGFDVPVPALDQEFDLALVGTKGKWYSHKVRVSNPTPAEDQAAG